MEPVLLKATNITPHVLSKTDANLSLKGRSLMTNAVTFFEPLIKWTSWFDAPLVNFYIELEYLNTSLSKKILELLKVIDNSNNIKEFNVIWNFNFADEAVFMKGQILPERLVKQGSVTRSLKKYNLF